MRSASASASASTLTPTDSAQPPAIFQGTDAVPQNRKVALARVIEAHQAFEAKSNQATTPTSTSSLQRPTSSSSSISHDTFAHEFSSIPVSNTEVRAFRYFQRLWDPSNAQWRDDEFDEVVAPRKAEFEESALKHFFSRIAMWDASLEVRESMSRSIFQRRRRSRAKSDLSSISAAAGESDDALKQVTTREGLAQLLWTLLQDPKRPLEGLQGEVKTALKEWLCMKNLTTGQKYDVGIGDGKGGETFVFMHGLGSSQNYYHGVTQVLVASGFRCITFDNTGAGRSPYTFVEQSIESMGNDVIGILDALKVEKAVFVGHSMGGIVGAHMAAERSDRIVAAILIGPVYPNPGLVPVFQKRIEAVEKEGMQALADSIPNSAVGEKASPLAKGMIRELLLSQDPAGYVSNCRVIINASPPQYNKISVPILILAGAEDKSAPLAGCKKMFEEMGSSEKRLEVMEGVGHWHCLEAFEEVAKLIEGFYHEITGYSR
ncbi:Alpha Beta hydrolase [Pyrenophora seminiperda CCB06]|uniref:Alpha Beta hydrolase n=1 Tax=Pyrenophora seminiperda CCB06 TaxID=1302712 RepID=A0A3M7MH05_9PLEO|nr:Alpha Beta hydrolase [Pyrenophora seminiperda CCB06]